jgi:hypothetical protein
MEKLLLGWDVSGCWRAGDNGWMRWKRILAIGAIAVLAGGAATAVTLLLTYHESTKIDRTDPEVVLIRYLDATFERKDPAMAGLYTCRRPEKLRSINNLREDLAKREKEFGVTITVTNGVMSKAADDISTQLIIEAFKDGRRNSRWTETWRFSMVDESGWRVCGAERIAQPSASATPSPTLSPSPSPSLP